jgi:hypothetical protein
MKAQDVRDYLAPRFRDLKFKGFQKVYFFDNDRSLEEGVILDFAKRDDLVFYRVAYVDGWLAINHITISERVIFETYDSVVDHIDSKNLNRHGILKHHMKHYGVIQDQLKMDIDEYLIYAFFNGSKDSEKKLHVPSEEVVKINRWASKVVAMRNTQNKYFRDRNYQDLTQSKVLEKEVDDTMDSAIRALASISSLLL